MPQSVILPALHTDAIPPNFHVWIISVAAMEQKLDCFVPNMVFVGQPDLAVI